MMRRLLAVLITALITLTGLAAAPTQAATPRDIQNVLSVWDGGDQWVFCHDLADYSGDLDYGVGDPPRAQWASWVRQLDACWGRKHIVHIRYNHEVNGDWFPWSKKTPAQFRRDFADFKAFVKKHSKHAISINFGLALNYTTHRYRVDDYWTPAADYVAVSMYETQWIAADWLRFRDSTAGPAWWWRWARQHNRRLAYGEWGAATPQWQTRMRLWGAWHGVYYGAYLYCGDGSHDCGRWIPYLSRI